MQADAEQHGEASEGVEVVPPARRRDVGLGHRLIGHRLQHLPNGFHEVVVEALGICHKIIHVLVGSRY